MPRMNYSIEDLEKLWIKLWAEMFNTEVEHEENYETGTVLEEFVRRVESEDPRR